MSVDELSQRIDGTSAWLSGGVALDHWLGRSTRLHDDIDVSITADGWAELRARLEPDLRAFRAERGWLAPATAEPSINTWFADADGRWRLQVNLEDGDSQSWRYRHDKRIALSWARAVLDTGGIATGVPEVQLLWKSRSPEPKDLAVWRMHLPALTSEQRSWLQSAVKLAHPGSQALATFVPY